MSSGRKAAGGQAGQAGKRSGSRGVAAKQAALAHPPYAAANGKASRASRLSSQSCARVSSAGHLLGLQQENSTQDESHNLSRALQGPMHAPMLL